jgi:hypothetical protein
MLCGVGDIHNFNVFWDTKHPSGVRVIGQHMKVHDIAGDYMVFCVL